MTLRSTLLTTAVTFALAGSAFAEGCDKVLNSAWGSLFGQPLALFGCLAYAAVLLLAVGLLIGRAGLDLVQPELLGRGLEPVQVDKWRRREHGRRLLESTQCAPVRPLQP